MLSGCQNKRELNEIAIVLGTGIDYADNGNFKLSVEVAKPFQVKAGGDGGGGGGTTGKEGKKKSMVETRMGVTVFDAVRNFSTINSKNLFFSHNQILIFGEEVARKGLGSVLDFFERDAGLRAEVPVLVAQGNAVDCLKLPPAMEEITATEINDALKLAEITGKSVSYRLVDLAKEINGDNYIAVPKISITEDGGEKRFEIAGMAVLKKGKLIGWLNPIETRGYLWIKGLVKGGVININYGGGKIALEIKRVNAKLKSEIRDGEPVFVVEVEENGNIDEVHSAVNIASSSVLSEINKKQAEAIENEINQTLKRCQKNLKADIFGFGENLHRWHPAYWKQKKDKWNDNFPSVPVEVRVKTKLYSSGEKTNQSFQKR